MHGISIIKDFEMSLFRQIYEQIRDAILGGAMKPGTKLPSTRTLAVDLGISRNVVVEAYEQLLAEGYLTSRQGSGTRVAEGACLEGLSKPSIASFRHVEQKLDQEDQKMIDFRSGMPALEFFSLKKWGILLGQVCSESNIDLLGYNEPAGRLELRQEIAAYLFRSRGIRCSPEQIVITTGATQGLALAAKLFYHTGAAALVEDPLNYGMRMVFIQEGYKLLPVPVDRCGIRTECIPVWNEVGFIYTTPSHQYPLGGILPVQRRIELIKFARDNACFIIEDDYDSEFRYVGPALGALYSLDPERVIYTGSFSKILAPSLRLGYMIVPGSLVKQCLRVKKYSDVHTPVIEQLALARFIEAGRLERYIMKLKKIYASRREAMIGELAQNFPGQHVVWGEATGLHITVEFPGIEFTAEVLQQIFQAGVRVYPVEKHAIAKGKYLNRVIMGYGHLSVAEIGEGVQRLKMILDACKSK